jgi:hypothetical protein
MAWAGDSLTYRRRLLALFVIGTSEFHVLPLAFGIGGIIFTLRNLHDEYLAPLLWCGLFWLPLALFGGLMSWGFSREPRKLTVSGRQIHLRRMIGGTKSIDIESLVRITVQGDDPRTIDFVRTLGSPLLSLTAEDWPKEMPAAIGDFLGVQVDTTERGS